MSIEQNLPAAARQSLHVAAERGPRAIGRRFAANARAWARALQRRSRARTTLRQVPPIPYPQWLAAIALSVAVVLLIMALADAHSMQWQRGLPMEIVRVFAVITDFGLSAWVLLPTGLGVLLLAALAAPQAGRMAYGVLTAAAARLGYIHLAVGLPGLAVAILKRLIGRVRPEGAAGPFDYVPWSWNPSFASLPSGHGTTIFAAATALAVLSPRLRWPALGLALVIGASRVILLEHFPSDVLAGAIVGCFGALMVRRWFANRRLVFAISPAGDVAAMPGPSLRRLLGALRTSLRG